MHALAYRADTEVTAHRSQGSGGIGHCEPHAAQAPGRVIALPRRGACDFTRPSSLALAAAARRHNTLLLQRLLSNALRHLLALAARGWAAWRQTQLARGHQRALRELDDRALRDLGLTRGEIASLEAELHGATQATRVLALQARRELSC